jgi:cobalt/nickel transport system permease protein
MCAVYGAAGAAAALGIAFAAARKSASPQPVRIALAGAFVFLMQSINVPVGVGVTGHLLGGVLLAHWFGAAWGAITMAIVLTVQSLVLGDGGLGALGVNILTMSVVPCLVVYPLARRAIASPWIRLAAGSWASVVAAAGIATLCILTREDARQAAGGLAFSMLGAHAIIGILEAGLTLAIAYAVRTRLALTPARVLMAGAALLLVASFGRSPSPDGLEFTLDRFAIKPVPGMIEAIHSSILVLADHLLPALAVGAAVVAATLVAISSRRVEVRHG